MSTSKAIELKRPPPGLTKNCCSKYSLVNQSLLHIPPPYSPGYMSDLFSTPAEHALDHPELANVSHVAGPSANGDAVASLSIEEAFEVDETCQLIFDGWYKTVRV